MPRRNWLEKLALAIFLIGAGPILAVFLLQKIGLVAADANPIGLGLLFVFAVPVAALLWIIAAAKRRS